MTADEFKQSMLPALPSYTCHKTVQAAKIVNLDGPHLPGGSGWLQLEYNGHRLYVHPGEQWFARHKPAIGGYFVIYEDGYTSFSPAKAFEEGYKLAEPNALELGAMIRAAGLQGE
jgi:hypothetical protein